MKDATNQPDLSIIIVSWNTRSILRRCLASIRKNSSGLRLEVFVVDNASMDGSPEMVASEFPEMILIRNSANRGFGPANNQAMRQATAPFALLLNSDTEVMGDALASSLRFVRANSDCAVMGWRVLNADGTLQRTCFRDPDLTGLALNVTGLHRLPWPRCFGRQEMRGWARDDVRDVDVVTGCFMLVCMQAVRDVGMFDERFFFYAEEADWCRRFRERGWRVMFAPVGEIVHLGGASALQMGARRSLLLGSALIELIRKHRGSRAAFAARMMIAAFLLSRAMIWSVAGTCTRRPDIRRRARELRGAVRRLGALGAPAAGATGTTSTRGPRTTSRTETKPSSDVRGRRTVESASD